MQRLTSDLLAVKLPVSSRRALFFDLYTKKPDQQHVPRVDEYTHPSQNPVMLQWCWRTNFGHVLTLCKGHGMRTRLTAAAPSWIFNLQPNLHSRPHSHHSPLTQQNQFQNTSN